MFEYLNSKVQLSLVLLNWVNYYKQTRSQFDFQACIYMHIHTHIKVSNLLKLRRSASTALLRYSSSLTLCHTRNSSISNTSDCSQLLGHDDG